MSSKQQETRREQQDANVESSAIASDPAIQPVEVNAFSEEATVAETAREDTSDSAAHDSPNDGADSRVRELEAEASALREELSSVNDKYLRKLADDANFRKRMVREKEDGQRYAVSGLLGDLIPVLDDFDRAIASAETQKDYTALHDGVVLIRRQLGSVLESKYGLSRFDSLNTPFDPNRHEAVAMVQGEPGGEATVAEEFLPGYGLHDRILRTAKVRVRMPAPAPDSPSNQAAPAAENSAN